MKVAAHARDDITPPLRYACPNIARVHAGRHPNERPKTMREPHNGAPLAARSFLAYLELQKPGRTDNRSRHNLGKKKGPRAPCLKNGGSLH